MKKPFKITIVFFVVLLVVTVAASLFVKSYLTEERMRALISGITEKSLNRKVMLGKIKVELFRGIVVKDLEVREKDSDAVFLKTKDFVLEYQFLPLLAKKLVIDKLNIGDVEIHLKANPDGTFNFTDMAKTGNKPRDKEDLEEKDAGLPVNLNVKKITIKNAKLGYVDNTGKLKKADVIMNATLGITGLSKNILSSEGSFDITIAEALLKDGNKSFKDIRMDARYKIDLDMDARQVTIHSINADILKIPVNIVGAVNYASGTSYSLDMKVPDCNLSGIRKDIASLFLPEGMALGGKISMQINIGKKNGREGSPDFNGNARMTMVSCLYKGINLVLDGSLKLAPEIIKLENIKLIAGQNSADISGSMKNYKAYPDLNVNIKSKSIDIDDFFVSAPSSAKSQVTAKSGGKEKEQTSANADDVKKEPGPMNLKLKANVSLDIDKTRYKGISITNFRSGYELKDNVFKIHYLNGNALRGAFALTAAVNLAQKGTQYKMTSDLSNMNIEEIINAFAPEARAKLFGILSGKTEITGAGTLPVNIKRNLKGKGLFAIKNGTLKNTGLSSGLLAVIGLQEMREIPIDTAKGNFTISGGIVNLTTLISSKDMAIDETGTIGMDEKLDLGILVKVSERLTPRLVSQSSITNFLSGERGWTVLPLRVGGTVSSPSYGIDMSAVGNRVGESVQKKIGQELLKILPKDRESQSGTAQKKSSNPLDIFKGLLGR